MIAVVEPTLNDATTIDLAKQVVDRGGRATVVVLLSRETKAAVAEFAESENLTFPDAHEIYLERLAASYSAHFGDHKAATIITDRSDANRFVFDAAARRAATSVAVPQRLISRRNWKSSVARSQIPVLIAPARAA